MLSRRSRTGRVLLIPLILALLLPMGEAGTAHAQLAPRDAGLTGVAGGAVAWGDVDGDGDPDLLVLGNETGVVETIDDAEPSTTLYENEGDGTFSVMNAGLTDVSAGAAAFADFDRDGDLDLVVTGVKLGTFGPARSATIYENDGTGSFTSLGAGIDGVTIGAVDWADVDNDGDLDLLVSGNTGGVGQFPLPSDPDPTTTIYENEGGGTFSPLGADLAGAAVGDAAFQDIDGDGAPDLIVTGGQGTSLDNPEPTTVLYENDGPGNFTRRSAGLADVAGGSVTWTDVEGDGDPDLILTGRDTAETLRTELYLNDGQGGFSPASTPLADVAGGTVAANDIDDDGAPDLVVSGRSADGSPVTTAYENDGTGAFERFDVDLTPVEGSAADWGDPDRDGHDDLVLIGRDADSVATATLYENQTAGRLLVAYGRRSVAGDAPVPFAGTGVSVNVSETSASGAVTVEKFADPPSHPRGIEEKTVSDYRFVLRAGGALSDGSSTEVRFDVSSLAGIGAPGNVVVYRRLLEGEGAFAKLSTSYDADTDALVATTEAGGEFVLASDTEPLDGSTDPLPIPTDLTATATDGPAIDLAWAPLEAAPVAHYRIYRDTSPFATGASGRSPVDSVAAGTTTYTDEEAPPGYTYYYRVTAVDTAGQESRVSGGTSAFIYPTTVAANATQSFDDASGPSDYRLVALPGQVDRSLPATLSGAPGRDWQAYRDDGSEEEYLIRYDGSEAFRFEPGTGLWLTARQDWAVEAEVPTVELEGDSAAVVPLRDGWNVVSNPTGKAVPTDRLRIANRDAADGTLDPLWGFDSTFYEADTMRSAADGVAYYFLNDQGLDALRIPYPGAPGYRTASSSSPSTVKQKASSWLAVTAQRPGDTRASGSTIRVGITQGASTPHSTVAPPTQFEALSLRVKAGDDVPARRRFLMSEWRVQTGDGAAFPLRLRTKDGGPVQLRVRSSSTLGGRTAVLVNPTPQTRHDLHPGETVTLRPEESSANLRLLVGSKQYVDEQAQQALPDEIRLTSTPNPMREQGTLAYVLPETRKVTLRVYDLLGRRVATLDRGVRRAGRHEVRLAPGSLSSGVYVGRLRAGEATRTEKITVVR